MLHHESYDDRFLVEIRDDVSFPIRITLLSIVYYVVISVYLSLNIRNLSLMYNII